MKYSINVIFTIMAIALLLSSCKESEQIAVPNVSIDVNKFAEPETFFDSVHYVRLETNDDCMISQIDKVRFSGTEIGILSNKEILVFSMRGKYLYKISKLGRGNEEYLDIDDFQFSGDTVLVLSSLNKALLSYKHGKFLQKFDLNDSYYQFVVTPTHRIVLASNNANDTKYNFNIYNLQNKTFEKEIDNFQKNEEIVFHEFNAFLSTGKEILVTHPFDDAIYRLSPNGIETYKSFKFNTTVQIPSDENSFSYYDLYKLTANKNVVKYISAYLKTADAEYLIYPLFGESGIEYYLTKIPSAGALTSMILCKNRNARFKHMFMTRYSGTYKQCIVTVGYPAQLIKLEKEYGINGLINAGIKVNDNPILFFYHLKP